MLVAMIAIIAITPCIAAAVPVKGGVPSALSLLDLSNRAVDLPSFKGSFTILFFFASWSKSCDKEVEMLNELYDAYEKKDLQIIGVSFDRDADEVKQFVKDKKIKFDIFVDKKLVSIDKYAILILPTTFTINKNGEIAGIYVDFDSNLKQSLAKFLGH
ncbi:hypothetical protein A3J90_04900 [candidate division WOR-1 bacterium RIFOXYC2_FULL_37_10]|uniref:Thioredoxin domain-containing protein n=1 Tax=candidate division WOR-1 bacterium RIFOXYB2_FULL_37_13 TaxID=1802579 RepID=A0A1F4SRU3_UNCSA|nr:MAG: hypothetical protein A2246_04970 [candidate division WOR-1 bacterium RIFOXYA2_FULL_37_7]OGC23156.1 MAG: hypothetical protein A2310_06035 [candidate division WOR-1 bacterium RIFOXYB2_FULL_37_13]OGC35560.1 MAG: hypothetical protein A3J90_04900 [candidate division WOR-1 bacterium RIFOXYC2_FULL_37_10]